MAQTIGNYESTLDLSGSSVIFHCFNLLLIVVVVIHDGRRRAYMPLCPVNKIAAASSTEH